jgi:hypothetical protein
MWITISSSRISAAAFIPLRVSPLPYNHWKWLCFLLTEVSMTLRHRAIGIETGNRLLSHGYIIHFFQNCLASSPAYVYRARTNTKALYLFPTCGSFRLPTILVASPFFLFSPFFLHRSLSLSQTFKEKRILLGYLHLPPSYPRFQAVSVPPLRCAILTTKLPI